MNTQGSTGHILIVDDEERIRDLFSEILAQEGHATQTAINGISALQMVVDDPPDLILLDIAMPGMSGLDVLKTLKADPGARHISVVIVTAFEDQEQRIEALRLGANDYLNKPVLCEELLARVSSLLTVKAYHDLLHRDKEELEHLVNERTRELRKAMLQLKRASLMTIYRLSKAAEFRDNETGVHIQRMALTCEIIAQALGLPAAEVECIRFAAPMHDIGKIGIPDQILLKPGKLDAEEWAVMKRHAEIGAKILSDPEEPLICSAAQIALTHHERWDGTGYPDRQRAKEIPLFGRIAALADVFDALVSVRPYKQAFSFEKAEQLIREGRGSHFDPAVVDAFIAHMSEVEQLYTQFKNDSHHETKMIFE